uniref:Chromosome 3 open reading frame 38 n=1 Tax=Cyprinus carpio TaxID=7962 RepID=A0A8C2GJ55_CYPCA
MSKLSMKEQSGCRKLLRLLALHDLFALKDTVTNRLIAVESTREAIEAIITYSQDAEELLKRKKVHRDVIFKYLATEGVAMPPNSDKQQLIRRTTEHWSSGEISKREKNTVVSEDVGDGLADLPALGKQFCQWFFTLLNAQNPTQGQPAQEWGPQHFWPDARLRLLSCAGEWCVDEFNGAELVSQRLHAFAGQEHLLFCPNLEGQGLKCISSAHGLVLVAVAGTIHRDNACLGVFENVFGLIRSPMDNNRWKIKSVNMKVEAQSAITDRQVPVITYDSKELLSLCD